jgi:hypothetical protein
LFRGGCRHATPPPLPDWRIWFFVLEACGLAVQLVNAAQARNLSLGSAADVAV